MDILKYMIHGKFKKGETYRFEHITEDREFICRVRDEGSSYFRTTDLVILRGPQSWDKEVIRGFDHESIQRFKVEKIDLEEYPEYFL